MIRARRKAWAATWFACAGLVGPAVMLAHPAGASAAGACNLYASTSGSDSASGSQSAPFRSAQKLADSLSAGQVGCLAPGQTFGGIHFNRSGVTITTAPGGARATMLGNTEIPDSANDVTIENVVLNGRTSGQRVSPSIEGDRAVLRNNEITNDNTAICIHVGSSLGYGVAYDVVIDGNRIHNCGRLPATNFDHGVYVDNAYRTRIVNNYIYDNSDYGVHLYPSAQQTYVAHNVIDGNGRGLTFSGDSGYPNPSSGNVVEFNTISNSKITTNIESWWGGGVGTGNVAHDNCVWNGAKGNIATQWGFTATNNTVADPGYANRAAKDFTIASGPCADKQPASASTSTPPPPPPSVNAAPSASFTANPAAPLTGQSVSFTDTSTDPDGTIASRSWDLNGDGVYGDATGANASYTFTTAGSKTVRVRVTDDKGAQATASKTLTVTDPVVAPPPPPPPSTGTGANLVANGSFETDASGWVSWQGAVSRVAVGDSPAGSWAAKVTNTAGTAYTIDDANLSASSTQAVEYTATAWVKAGSASAVGKASKLYIRERTSTGATRTVSGTAVALSNGFQKITAAITPAAGSQLEIYVDQKSAVAGDAFIIDGITLGAGTVTDPAPPPPAPNTAPIAAFTANPAAPLTGQAVSFTDTSSDVDGTIASRSWDLNGDGVFGDATGASASYTFTSAGSKTVRLQVTDDKGAQSVATQTVTVTDPAPPPPPPSTSTNLVANGSFESDVAGWGSWQGAVSRVQVTDAPSGSWVAKVARTTGTAFTIDDSVASVSSASAVPHTATAWVKAGSASSVGKSSKLYLRERTASGTTRTVSGTAVALGNGYQKITASITPAAGSQIEVYVDQSGAVAGDAFLIDGISVTK